MEPVMLIHGGAGELADAEKVRKLTEGVKAAAIEGYRILKDTGNALDAVEAAVNYMEEDETFNAGRGSVLNIEGDVEMDASIMLGADLSAGGVTLVRDIKHPISLARMVKERTKHLVLGAEGAKLFAIAQGVEILPPGSLVTKKRCADLQRILKERSDTNHETGTVGAVAVNSLGKMAAGTSTGGLEGKMVGRCSDSSVIGSGTYADDDSAAVSSTGHGETIAKFCLAHSICTAVKLGKPIQEAVDECVQTMTEKLCNTAGAIAVDSKGEVGIAFSTPRMSWAYVKAGKVHFGVIKGQHDICDL